jgi:sporulation protein YqfC
MKFNDFALAEVVGSAPRVVIRGQNEALIEKHRGLLSYDTACVRIRSADGEVRLEGKNLSIPYFGTEDMIVAGKIERVCFEGEPA